MFHFNPTANVACIDAILHMKLQQHALRTFKLPMIQADQLVERHFKALSQAFVYSHSFAFDDANVGAVMDGNSIVGGVMYGKAHVTDELLLSDMRKAGLSGHVRFEVNGALTTTRSDGQVAKVIDENRMSVSFEHI